MTMGAGGVGLVGLMTVLTGGCKMGGGGLGGGTFSSSSVRDFPVLADCVAVIGAVMCTGLARYSTRAPVHKSGQKYKLSTSHHMHVVIV